MWRLAFAICAAFCFPCVPDLPAKLHVFIRLAYEFGHHSEERILEGGRALYVNVNHWHLMTFFSSFAESMTDILMCMPHYHRFMSNGGKLPCGCQTAAVLPEERIAILLSLLYYVFFRMMWAHRFERKNDIANNWKHYKFDQVSFGVLSVHTFKWLGHGWFERWHWA